MNLFAKLRAANAARQLYWPGSENTDALYHAVEFGEEAGEVLGAVKKLTRVMRGIAGNNRNNDLDSRMRLLREEVGDAIISLDLLCGKVGIKIEDCVPMKFNMTSQKNGISVEMDPDTWEVRT